MENHKDNNYPKLSEFLTEEELEMMIDYQDSIFISELLKILPNPNAANSEMK